MRNRFLAIVALLALSCGRLKELPTDPGLGSGEPIDPTATFTRVQNEIFTPTCAALGCHDRLGKQQGLILAPGSAYAQTVGVASTENPQLLKVKPNDVANSYLYRKITGAGITGDRMPQGGPYLTDAQIKLVRDWIRRGAPND
jgi:hypothetical protein